MRLPLLGTIAAAFAGAIAACESVPNLTYATPEDAAAETSTDEAGDAGGAEAAGDGADAAPGCPSMPPTWANACCGATPCQGMQCGVGSVCGNKCSHCAADEFCCAMSTSTAGCVLYDSGCF
jgi:hypothetical protein